VAPPGRGPPVFSLRTELSRSPLRITSFRDLFSRPSESDSPARIPIRTKQKESFVFFVQVDLGRFSFSCPQSGLLSSRLSDFRGLRFHNQAGQLCIPIRKQAVPETGAKGCHLDWESEFLYKTVLVFSFAVSLVFMFHFLVEKRLTWFLLFAFICVVLGGVALDVFGLGKGR